MGRMGHGKNGKRKTNGAWEEWAMGRMGNANKRKTEMGRMGTGKWEEWGMGRMGSGKNGQWEMG